MIQTYWLFLTLPTKVFGQGLGFTMAGFLQPFVGRMRGAGRLQRLLLSVGEPRHWVERMKGYEDFGFPGTYWN